MLVAGMVTLTKRRRERWSHTKTQIQIHNTKKQMTVEVNQNAGGEDDDFDKEEERVRARQREVQHLYRQFHRHSRQLDEHHPHPCRHPDKMISICGCGVGGTQRFRLVRAHPL